MISAAQFKERWQHRDTDCLVAFPAQALEEVRVPDDAKAFLLEAGLPAEAAPFLNFSPPKKGPIPRVSETLWHLTPQFACYRVIGSNGSGDPVCIEESEGRIVYLDHENYFEPVLMGSSVFTLAECLLAFRAFITDAASSSSPMTQERIGVIIGCLQRIDPEACQEGGFWFAECRNIAA